MNTGGEEEERKESWNKGGEEERRRKQWILMMGKRMERKMERIRRGRNFYWIRGGIEQGNQRKREKSEGVQRVKRLERRTRESRKEVWREEDDRLEEGKRQGREIRYEEEKRD